MRAWTGREPYVGSSYWWTNASVSIYDSTGTSAPEWLRMDDVVLRANSGTLVPGVTCDANPTVCASALFDVRGACVQPTFTPTAGVCSTTTYDVSGFNQSIVLRKQPALDNENWLFEIPAGNLPRTGTAIQNRPYLWSPLAVPSSLSVHSVDLIARVGVIGWVDPDVDWYQVRVTGVTNAGAFSLVGYVGVTNPANATVVNVSCSAPQALGTPLPDAGMPVAGLAVFTAMAPQARVFNGNQSPSTMGGCGQHVGADNPCAPDPTGSTIDIVPRNIEMCIDSRSQARLVECDPRYAGTLIPNVNPNPQRVPIYSPREGCVLFEDRSQEVPSIIIRFQIGGVGNCSDGASNADFYIVLTHVTDVPSNIPRVTSLQNRLLLPAGSLVGYLCLAQEARGICKVAEENIPTHLAFQIQDYQGGYQQVPTDIRGYLARQGCLYDDWRYLQNNTPQAQTTPVRACP
jgi:hypothetical protein